MRSCNNKLTMTVLDVYHDMREAVISTNPARISAGIASGAYPFGRVVATGETGRKTFEIFRVDFEAWLESKIPSSKHSSLPGYKGPLELKRHVM